MNKKGKEGLKKHSPHQTETEPSIVSQIPEDKMGQAIQELIELAQKRKGSPDPQFKPMDQESYQEVARVDPPDGLLSQVPPRVDPDPMAGMPSPLRSQEETKGNKPK